MIDLVLPRPRQAWLSELRATIALAWPLALTNVAQIALNTTDVVMMGWLGPGALAAGALGFNLYFAFAIFGIGVVSATAPMIARERGRNRHAVREIRRTLRQGLWTALAIAVPVWAVLWHTETILLAIGQDPALSAEAGGYMRAAQWALFPFLGYIALRSFVAAMERPQAALWVAGFAIVFNALANWVLMFGNLGAPALGLLGAGIATTLASMVMFGGLALLVSLDRTFRRYQLFGRFWRADWQRFRALWRLGLPIGGTLVFEVTIFNAAVFLMGLIGVASLAAHSIAIQIASVSFMVPLGLSQAASVRVGRAFGAGDSQGIRLAGWTAYAVGVSFMAMMALVFLLAPGPLVGVFLDRNDPANAEVIALAVTFLAFAALFQVFDGAQAVASGMLRGLHDTRIPMLMALLGYWGVGLPFGVLLAFPLGLAGAGVWIGLATGLAVVATLMTLRWLMRDRLGIAAGGSLPGASRAKT